MTNAQWTDRGYIAACPVTKETYISSTPRLTTIDGKRGVILRCRHCDTAGHIRADAAFDPSRPQSHKYLLDEVRYGDV